MKYINVKLLVLAILLIAVIGSCTRNFKEFNTDPNALPAERINDDNVYLGGFFKTMAENIIPLSVNDYQVIQNLAGDVFGGYHGQTRNWNAAGDNTTYNFSIGWNKDAFNSFYTNIIKNYDTVSKYAANNPDIIAVATIIKVTAAHRIVDMYGPVPYFKTQGVLGVTGAAYDAQDKIYHSFFKDLDSAIVVLKRYAGLEAEPLKYFDPVYRGNYTQWVKFANSLKLRLALRIVYADADKARQYAEEAVNSEAGFISNIADNAELRGVFDNTPTNNPLHGVSVAYKEARMSANMESFLVGYNDPRVKAFFEPDKLGKSNGESYKGIRSGIPISDGTKYQPFSILKTGFNIIWMSAAEVDFLRAEGALRGWNMGGTAQEFYESGIKLSLEQWRVGGADAYIKNSSSTAISYVDPVNKFNRIQSLTNITIKWEETTDFERKLERIITQKWIAMYPNGQEAWSEFRRTNYPALFPVRQNKGPDPRLNPNSANPRASYQVKRLPYPAGEYRLNAENVAGGVSLLGGADLAGTRLWWDKNPKIK